MTRTLIKAPPWLTRRLDSWQFWFMVALAGVIASLVLGYNSLERTIHDENVRQQASYAACVESIPELRKIATHIRGVNAMAIALVANARSNLLNTPPDDPSYVTRAANVARLRIATDLIAAAPTIPVPTREFCRAQAHHPALPRRPRND